MSGLGDVAGGGDVALLLAAPGVHARVDVTTDVIGAGGSLRLAQLPVRRPHLVIDADHAARGALRRHVDSVADQSGATHPYASTCVADVLRVTVHPEVESETGQALIKPP